MEEIQDLETLLVGLDFPLNNRIWKIFELSIQDVFLQYIITLPETTIRNFYITIAAWVISHLEFDKIYLFKGSHYFVSTMFIEEKAVIVLEAI